MGSIGWVGDGAAIQMLNVFLGFLFLMQKIPCNPLPLALQTHANSFSQLSESLLVASMINLAFAGLVDLVQHEAYVYVPECVKCASAAAAGW